MPASAPKLTTGKASGDVKLSGPLFESDFNEHLVWHVVRNEQLWRRQGTHKTKTRGEVSGGGAKPWRQKGTGRARAGSSRSPIWTGGGTTFGPSPRSYGGKVNRKERDGAFRSALSMHAERGSFAVLEDAAFDKPNTKGAAAIRTSWEAAAGKKTVVVCTLDQVDVAKSFRNLDDVTVVAVTDLDVVDVMWGRAMLVTEAALEALNGKAS